MAENKQYVTQIQDNGTILISEDVLASIITQAVKDVEGVVGLSTKPGADIADMIGKKNWGKGLRIVIAEDNSLTIDAVIYVKFGNPVVEVAKAVQSNIIDAVESTTGVTVRCVNVNVNGSTSK